MFLAKFKPTERPAETFMVSEPRGLSYLWHPFRRDRETYFWTNVRRLLPRKTWLVDRQPYGDKRLPAGDRFHLFTKGLNTVRCLQDLELPDENSLHSRSSIADQIENIMPSEEDDDIDFYVLPKLVSYLRTAVGLD